MVLICCNSVSGPFWNWKMTTKSITELGIQKKHFVFTHANHIIINIFITNHE